MCKVYVRRYLHNENEERYRSSLDKRKGLYIERISEMVLHIGEPASLPNHLKLLACEIELRRVLATLHR